MVSLQRGHSETGTEQLQQQQRCPHGTNIIWHSRSKQMTHSEVLIALIFSGKGALASSIGWGGADAQTSSQPKDFFSFSYILKASRICLRSLPDKTPACNKSLSVMYRVSPKNNAHYNPIFKHPYIKWPIVDSISINWIILLYVIEIETAA